MSRRATVTTIAAFILYRAASTNSSTPKEVVCAHNESLSGEWSTPIGRSAPPDLDARARVLRQLEGDLELGLALAARVAIRVGVLLVDACEAGLDGDAHVGRPARRRLPRDDVRGVRVANDAARSEHQLACMHIEKMKGDEGDEGR